MDIPEYHEEPTLAERARAIVPGGASTGSKRPQAIFGDDAAPDLPSHYVSASGCEVTLADGTTLTDCTMALGSVALGYADDVVNHAVMSAIAAGNVSALSPVLEVELAERLSELIPCAESVRFLKTGAEGTAAAVRIARAHTGRNRVIGCGYFGWLDWCSSDAGIPDSVRQEFTAVPFDDATALEREARSIGSDLAAIILEPVIGALPGDVWIKRARELCTSLGAVLIFDELKTGFRLHTAGYQALSGLVPDIAVFGKALANGFPLSAVVGRAEIMSAASRTWISSTLASETAALAAAGAVLDWHERAEVCESLAGIGEEMRRAVGQAIAASGIEGVRVTGIDQMWSIEFADSARESRFLSLALEHGVLFKRGAYNFPCLSHDDEALRRIEYASSTALVQLLEEESGSGESPQRA